MRRIMDSWIWQPGYPLVSAALVDSGDTPAVRLSQQRFAFASDAGGDAAPERWSIPVGVSIDGVTTSVLLEGDDPQLVELANRDAVVVVNAEGHGFFRVAYDDELRRRLDGDALASLSTLERYGLVDDAWSATVAGRLAAPDMLRFLEGFGAERSLAVWQVIAVALRGLGRLVADDALDAFRSRGAGTRRTGTGRTRRTDGRRTRPDREAARAAHRAARRPGPRRDDHRTVWRLVPPRSGRTRHGRPRTDRCCDHGRGHDGRR